MALAFEHVFGTSELAFSVNVFSTGYSLREVLTQKQNDGLHVSFRDDRFHSIGIFVTRKT